MFVNIKETKLEFIRFKNDSQRKVYHAIKNLDFKGLKKAIDCGFDRTHIFITSPPDRSTRQSNCPMADTTSWCLLELAVCCRFYRGVEYLIRQPRILFRQSLLKACEMKDSRMIKIFFDRACEHECTRCLFELLESGKLSVAEDLVNIDEFSINDQTMTISADHLRSAEARSQQSPVHACVIWKAITVIEILMSRGAKTDIADCDGYTPLYLACRLGSLEVCRRLVRHGADPSNYKPTSTYIDGKHRSPLYAICNLLSPSPENDEIVGILLKAGINFNAELWLTTGSQLPSISSGTADIIRSLRRNPIKLETQCCRAIRKHFSESVRGTSILSRIEALKIPPILLETRF